MAKVIVNLNLSTLEYFDSLDKLLEEWLQHLLITYVEFCEAHNFLLDTSSRSTRLFPDSKQ